MDKEYSIYIIGIPEGDKNPFENFLSQEYGDCYAGVYKTPEVSIEKLRVIMAGMLGIAEEVVDFG